MEKLEIKELFESLLKEQSLENIKILEIFKTGSQLFIDNPKDLDYVAICENYPYKYIRTHRIIDNKTYDLLILDKEETIKKLTFVSEEAPFKRAKIYNYMHVYKETIFGDDGIEWDLFKWEKEYKKYLKDSYVSTLGKLISKDRFSKGFVHYYIILEFYKNKEMKITEEMKENITLLYSRKPTTIDLINKIDQEIRSIQEE